MERFRIVGLLLIPILLAPALAAQSLQAPPLATPPESKRPTAFEVTDIHLSPFRFGGGYFHVAPLTRDRFVAYHATPLDLLTMAYKVEEDAVTGGPPGLAFDRYDIVARLPPGSTQPDTPRMLQVLLADRFKLVIDSQTRPLPAFLLKTGKGPVAMKPAADLNAESDCRYQPPNPPPPPDTPFPSTITLKCSNMTMEQFADQLREFGWQSFNHPVVDATGLKGAWDFDFRFSWQPGVPDAVTIPAAVEKLGLKIEAGTAPRPAIVITSMADAPTANVAAIERLLPPLPPPSFEVAVIRPSKSQWKDSQVRFDGNQVTIAATELRLVSFAWDISVKTVFDGPAFFDNQVWEITAKLPTPDAPATPGARPMIDFNQVRLMMRSLLAERFGLKAHTEDRPGMAYTLYAGSPKLKAANPANRASCTEVPAPGEKNPRADNPLLTQYTHCDNVTMEQFAREFQAHSGYIIKSPVLNRTGIEGRYDVTLNFSSLDTLETLGIVPNAHGLVPTADGDGGGAGPGDPRGVPVMLIDAVAKQLGLKLVFEKRPISVLVVDHIDEKPTDN